MGYDGTIYFGTAIDDKNLKPQLGNMKKSLSASFASMRDIMMGPVGIAKSVIGAIGQIGKALDGMMESAAENAKAQALLQSTLKATGSAAWTSSTELNKYAETMANLTLFEDDAITSMQGVLLGFKNIKGDNFKSASTEILNMATVMGMDLASAAQAVGKALDDPIAGIDSLSRQGFKFSKEQKTLLKSLVETGQAAKAQKIILDELSTTYGGAAEAAAQTAGGIYKNMKKSYKDMIDSFGEYTALSMQGINKELKKGFDKTAADMKKWNNVMKVEMAIEPLLKKKGVKTADVEKQLAAYGLSWGDAADIIEKQITEMNAEYAKLDPMYAQKEGYKEIIKPYKDMQKLALYNKALQEKIVEERAADDKAADEKAEREKKDAEWKADQLEIQQENEGRYVDWEERIAQIATNDALARADAEAKAYEDGKDDEVEAAKSTAEQIAAYNIEYAEQIAAYNIEYAEVSREAWSNLFSGTASAFSSLSSGIQEIAGEGSSVLSGSMEALSSVFTAAASGFGNVAADINAVTAIISLAGEQMPAIFAGVIEEISAIASTLGDGLAPLFTVILSTVSMLLPILQPVFDIIAAAGDLIAPFIPLVGAFVQLYMIFTGLEFLLPLIVLAIQLVADAVTWLYNKVVVPVYNWLIMGFNKIYNAFADFINGLLAMVDNIPFVDMGYRVARKDENAGTISEIGTAAQGGASGTYATGLAESNAELEKNKELFTLAAKAADAYSAVLTNLTDTISSFYDGLKNIGSDISGMIIDSINQGFDNDDFLYALEQYITESVIQAAVFTESFTAQVSQIGTQLAQAIARGDSSAIEALKNQLSALASAAAITAQAATDAVAGAFGSYAVGSMGLPSNGLIYAHAGEGVIPSGLMSEAARSGLTIAPTSSLARGLGNMTINLEALLNVDGLSMARVAFKYQDEVAGAAYGT